jgi:hypothetical protein
MIETYFTEETTAGEARDYFLRAISLYRSIIGVCEICHKQIVSDCLVHLEESEELDLNDCDVEELHQIMLVCLDYRHNEIKNSIHGQWSCLCDCQDTEEIDEALDQAIPF